MKKKPLIPFRLLPASWGLSGQPFDEAEAAYLYEGEDLERRLVEIRTENEPLERAKQLLALDRKYHKIGHYDYDKRLIELDGKGSDKRALLDLDFKHARLGEYEWAKAICELEKDGIERDVELANLELRFKKIEPREHEKRVATAKQEPWVGVVGDEFDVNQGIDGLAIELDWNEYWIEYLRLNGYVGHSDEQIIDQWFNDVCRSMIGPDDRRQHDHPF